MATKNATLNKDALNKDALVKTAQAMLAPGQGILAADESTGTIAKRLASIGLESTQEKRRDWRHLLFSSNDAMQAHIGGVILFEETLFQKDAKGTPLCEHIRKNNAVIGIKVDKGITPLALCPNETITQGLDGLRERLGEYYKAGARFAKWRAVLSAGGHLPSQTAIRANCDALARYAALCQEEGLVPIVEPEVLMDGAHEIEYCAYATRHTLKTLYDCLFQARVWLEGTVLKPNMVISGLDCPTQASEMEVAEATVATLSQYVPAAVAGIAFLSGGQSDIKATAHLHYMNALRSAKNLPWPLSFSYGRALQAAPLKSWAGKPDNIQKAQMAFAHRAKMNGLASLGQWNDKLETA